MHTILKTFFLRVRQSYWFWPSVLAVAALFAGWGMVSLDAAWANAWIRETELMRPMGVDGARQLLATVAGAILSVAGVAFSVTIVAVSFASANYGPRLIGNFMSDRTNQLVLGVFVATFVYCITVLSMVQAPVEEGGPGAFVPQLAILLALGLTLASIGALIAYIHHIPESIDIMNLAATIGRDLRRSIDALYSEDAIERGDADVDVPLPRPSGDGFVVGSDDSGYVQNFDLRGIERVATAAGVQVEILRGAGEFVVRGEPLLAVRPAERVGGEVARDLRGTIIIGANRTGLQDVLFLSDQLVEVLARALSPGVNDPYTAMICLDWLRDGLSLFAASPHPPVPPPSARILLKPVSFDDILPRTFDRMRQYIAGDRNVTLHAMGVLADLAIVAATDTRATAIRDAMGRLAASADERLEESAAREEVRRALEAHLSTVAAARAAGQRTPGLVTAGGSTRN
jgi:uncharacterized membrane protein